LNAERWQRLRSILEQALELEPGARTAYLRDACSDDAELLAEARRLLAREDEARARLTSPVAGVIEGALQGGSFGPRPGERIAGYRLVRPIGAGGMGTVWEAEQKSPQRIVALKLLRYGFHASRDVERFRYEAEVLGRLQHTGIAQVYEAGVSSDGDGLPFFAMEFVEGARSLLDHARELGLSRRARLELFEQVCEAVHHAHQKGVIHRDLKPGNILVDARGRVKVIDFGVARALAADPEARTRRTESGQIVGTLQYMSPEQFGPDPQDLDTRTDVYSLGVVLYELLLGRSPFDLDGRPIHEIATIVSTKPPRRPSTVDPTLPRELEWIVEKAMDTDRERRYASVSDVAADLRRFLADQPVQAGRTSTIYRVRKFVRRNRLAVGAALALTVALLLGLAGTGVGLLRAREENRRVMRLADTKRLADLEREAAALWPPEPERVPAYDAWLARARELQRRLPLHRGALAELDPARAQDIEAQWHHEALSALVDGLQSFFEPEHGTYADVERQFDFALTIEERSRTGAEASARWREALDAIASTAVCPSYRGLRITPQLGLLPLGQDPESGLWAFAHLQSGAPPERDDGGRFVPHEDSGLVLVLLPGGTFTKGSQRDDAAAPNYDPSSRPTEQPMQQVELDPVFMSKYEVTQAQWLRIAGVNPSWFPSEIYEIPAERPLLHPVEQVSWNDCAEMLGRWSLVLPTAAQWEYACRAGTTSPWWTGTERESLAGAANHADKTLIDLNGVMTGKSAEAWLEDGGWFGGSRWRSSKAWRCSTRACSSSPWSCRVRARLSTTANRSSWSSGSVCSTIVKACSSSARAPA
jgi:formylglycine-generating enzyme required for sulfatase activity